MNPILTRILKITVPAEIRARPADQCNPAFDLSFQADGFVPFPQIIIRGGGREFIYNCGDVRRQDDETYHAAVPAGILPVGQYQAQAEGCRQADIGRAGSHDWIKFFMDFHVLPPAAGAVVAAGPGTAPDMKIYFGIHKHMHQPYYRAADPGYWDGEKDGIFGQRSGAYTRYVPAAIRHYAAGQLPHAGLSTSWSGSLIEQLNRCQREGLGGGAFAGWADDLRAAAMERTALGHPRLDFSAFGFCHPLLPLIPARDIVRQILRHRDLVRETFGCEAARFLFPPETAFHVRMIPALLEAGVDAVIYDSIHRYRTCRDYPYGGTAEGMLPPNPAEQENPPMADWTWIQNVWSGSKISPGLLRPEYIKYVDPEGRDYRIIGIPAERYIGNEDARGGFGALQYPYVFEQLYRNLQQHGPYDPQHPPFFLLHSDGDNYGGGTDAYYMHNTARLVEWLSSDPRFELTTARDYLDRFPPDPARAVHVEPGAWSGADNGDPQFHKWFSRYTEPYSPDLNSWAVLTALQNIVHALEDAGARIPAAVERLLLTAETSCYWYWTGQTLWDQQVTEAANAALGLARGALDDLVRAGRDRTPPTIFPPWVIPENPGGKTWGQGGLQNAARDATAHTFVYDVAGLRRVEIVLRAGGGEQRLAMTDHGDYPCQTGAQATARHYTCALPAGLGDVRYYIEAEDGGGRVARGALERICLA